MTPDEARAMVAEILGRIAPGEDLSDVEPDADLRDEIDLDSLDFLGMVEVDQGAHRRRRPGGGLPQGAHAGRRGGLPGYPRLTPASRTRPG